MVTNSGLPNPPLPPLRRGRAILVAGCLTVLHSFLCPAATLRIPRGIPEVGVLRSRPERFVVVGTNRVWNANLMRWVETMAGKVVDVTGLAMPFEHRTLRVVVPRPAADPDRLPPMARQGIVNGALVQELSIHDYQNVDVEAADTALCRLLLNGYVAYRWANAPVTNVVSQDQPPEVPMWLARGTARNVYPARKAANADAFLTRWERGQAPSLKQFLEPSGAASPREVRDEAASGLFVAWLSDRQDGDRLFDALFRRIATGGEVSADWLIEQLPECESAADLERAWDQWVLRQKRVVYLPGVLTARVLKQFQDELVMQTLPDGPLATEPGGQVRMELAELIGRRGEAWVRDLARRKIARLKILFLGRGDAMDGVIDAYCLFLSSLAEGRRERHLRALLQSAQEKLDAIERQTAPDVSQD